MYLLETGFGEVFKPRDKKMAKTPAKAPHKLPPKMPVISQPRIVPEDQLLVSVMKWNLNVPFREDFGAFRQEMAKAIMRHIRTPSSIQKADDWILKSPENEQRLKGIHDNLKRVMQESDIIIVSTRFTYIRSLADPGNDVSTVEILSARK